MNYDSFSLDMKEKETIRLNGIGTLNITSLVIYDLENLQQLILIEGVFPWILRVHAVIPSFLHGKYVKLFKTDCLKNIFLGYSSCFQQSNSSFDYNVSESLFHRLSKQF